MGHTPGELKLETHKTANCFQNVSALSQGSRTTGAQPFLPAHMCAGHKVKVERSRKLLGKGRLKERTLILMIPVLGEKTKDGKAREIKQVPQQYRTFFFFNNN